MITYGIFNPGSFVAPSSPISILSIDHTILYLRLLNNSPYQLTVNIGGNIINISEFWQKDVAIGSTLPAFVIITPSLAITSSSHSQASQLTVQGIVAGDGGGDLDGPIPQQAVTTTATGKPVYSATFGWGPSAQVRQYLNLFNPANSGIIFHIHSARSATADLTHPRAVMLYSSGADLNLANAVSIQSHAGISAPPTSVGHATAVEQAAGIAGLTEIESLDFDNPPTVPKDFVTFPDIYDLYPGGNLTLLMLSGATGNNVRLTLKWTEDTVVPAILVLGPNMIANAIVNDGNPAGTSIIEATPAGFGVSTVHIFNDGTGGWFVDQAGTYHQVMAFNSSGTPLQLGTGLDIVEVLGQLLVDRVLQLAQPGTVVNGSVSGTATFYTPIWGSAFKVLVVDFNNYQSANIASFSPPTVMNHVIMGWTGNMNNAWTLSLFRTGVAQNLQQLTAFGAGGAAGTFSVSETSMHMGCLFVGISSWDQIQFAIIGSAQTGSVIIIGV